MLDFKTDQHFKPLFHDGDLLMEESHLYTLRNRLTLYYKYFIEQNEEDPEDYLSFKLQEEIILLKLEDYPISMKQEGNTLLIYGEHEDDNQKN